MSNLDNALDRESKPNARQLSRRTFCRAALIGSTLLGLMAWQRGIVSAQEDELDSPELEELLSIGVMDDEETDDIEEPDLEDPSIDSFQVFLPLVQGDPSSQAANDNTMSATASAMTAEQAKPTSNREKALRQAMAEIGQHEEPLGSNRTKYGRYFGVNHGAYWCLYFVSWAFDMTGNRDHRVPWPAGPVQGLLDWARAKERQGRHVLFTEPRRGDILVMKGGGVSHVGIVRWVYKDGSIRTVEGNTSKAGDGRAVWVADKRRNPDALRASGIPCYFVRVPKNPW